MPGEGSVAKRDNDKDRPSPITSPAEGFERLSVRVPTAILERLRNIVVRLESSPANTMTALVNQGILRVVESYEAPALDLSIDGKTVHKPAGAPFPPRTNALRKGRPMT